jgi:hypothetical protein
VFTCQCIEQPPSQLVAVQSCALLADRWRKAFEAGNGIIVGVSQLVEFAQEATLGGDRGPGGACHEQIDGLEPAADLLVRLDPRRRRAGVAQDPVGHGHVAGVRLVVQLEWAATSRKVVEGARLLGLADEALGQSLPARRGALIALTVASDDRVLMVSLVLAHVFMLARHEP